MQNRHQEQARQAQAYAQQRQAKEQQAKEQAQRQAQEQAQRQAQLEAQRRAHREAHQVPPFQSQQRTNGMDPKTVQATTTTSEKSHSHLRNGTAPKQTNPTGQGRISPIAGLLNPDPGHAVGMLAAQELARQALQHGQQNTLTDGHGKASRENSVSLNIDVASTPVDDSRWHAVRETASPAVPSSNQSSRTGSPAMVKSDAEAIPFFVQIAGYKEGNEKWRIFDETVKLFTANDGVASGVGGTMMVNAHRVAAVQFNKEQANNVCEVVVWSSNNNNTESIQHFLFRGSPLKGMRFQKWIKSINPRVTQMESADKVST